MGLLPTKGSWRPLSVSLGNFPEGFVEEVRGGFGEEKLRPGTCRLWGLGLTYLWLY